MTAVPPTSQPPHRWSWASLTDQWTRLIILFTGSLTTMTPLVFFWLSLPVLLRQAGVSFALIGLTYLVYIPSTFSFFWAPWIDNQVKRAPRAHLTWILRPLVAMTVATLVLAAFEPASSSAFVMIFLLIMLVATLSATARIAVMGYSVAAFNEAQRPLASVAILMGTAVAALIGAGGLLLVHAHFGWAAMVATMTALSACGIPVAAVAPAAAPALRVQGTNQKASLRAFFRGRGIGGFLVFLVLLGVGVGTAFGMIPPMLVESGYSTEHIAFINAVVGFGTLLVGGPPAALMIRVLGLTKTLTLALALNISLFVVCAMISVTALGGIWGIVIVAVIFMSLSFLDVPSNTFFMRISDRGQENTDLSTITSIYFLTSIIGAAISGVFVSQLGFWATFAVAALLTAGSIVALNSYFRRTRLKT